MRTFKKSAMCNENPEYMIRNPYLLLQRANRDFFISSERSNFNIPMPHTLIKVIPEIHGCESQDFPFETKISNHYKIKLGVNRFRIKEKAHRPLSVYYRNIGNPYFYIRKCIRETRNDSESPASILKIGIKKDIPKIFRNFLDHNIIARENKMKFSFLKNNISNLRSCLESKSMDSPYKNNLNDYCNKIENASSRTNENFNINLDKSQLISSYQGRSNLFFENTQDTLLRDKNKNKIKFDNKIKIHNIGRFLGYIIQENENDNDYYNELNSRKYSTRFSNHQIFSLTQSQLNSKIDDEEHNNRIKLMMHHLLSKNANIHKKNIKSIKVKRNTILNNFA